MNLRFLLAILAASFSLVLAASPAQAQATRTWISGTGSDANPCSRTAPCQTLAGALSKTIAGGEINCLDPGGIGAVTISKSITIDCEGTMGSVLASATNAVIVNIANGVVILRNISIQGAPPTNPGLNGVRIVAAAQVNIENVRIQGFRATSAGNGFGVLAIPSSGTTIVYITNSIISHNGAAANGGGVRAAPTGTGAVAMFLNGVELNNNFQGLSFSVTGTSSSSSALSVHNTVMFRNPGGGMQLNSNANALPVMLDGVNIDGNNNGLVMNGAGISVRLGASTVTFNGTAISNTGASILSYKNNQIDLNGNNSTPINQVQAQ